jgi:Leucine-rich repeat (LRR) protein
MNFNAHLFLENALINNYKEEVGDDDDSIEFSSSFSFLPSLRFDDSLHVVADHDANADRLECDLLFQTRIEELAINGGDGKFVVVCNNSNSSSGDGEILKTITELHLRCQRMNDVRLRYIPLCIFQCESLTSLSLMGGAVATLNGIQKLVNLKHLNMSSNNIYIISPL